MRLSALFEEFCHYLRVEKEAAPRSIDTYKRCFQDFLEFARTSVGATVLIVHFNGDLVRAYQYELVGKELAPATIRLRLATLGSFARWAVRREKLERNPLELLTRPKKRNKLPVVPRWEAVEELIGRCSQARDKALLALMTYGGLRRSEIVALNVGDVAPEFGLRRVQGKGGHEATVPLPQVARTIVAEYLSSERSGAKAADPLFLVRYRWRGGEFKERRMSGLRVWKLVKALGKRVGIPELHPHAFRHSCGVELLRRTGGNLRVVQEHLRHSDIQTTTLYTRLMPFELSQAVGLFDRA